MREFLFFRIPYISCTEHRVSCKFPSMLHEHCSVYLIKSKETYSFVHTHLYLYTGIHFHFDNWVM